MQVERCKIETAGYYRDEVPLKGIRSCLRSIVICRESGNSAGNYMQIELSSKYKRDEEGLDYEEITRLRQLGASLIFTKDERPLCLEVKKHQDIATVVDWLFRHNYMTESEKSTIDSHVFMAEMTGALAEANPRIVEYVRSALLEHSELVVSAAEQDHDKACRWFLCMLAAEEQKIEEGASILDFRKKSVREPLLGSAEHTLYLLAQWFNKPKSLKYNLEDRAIQKIIWDLIVVPKEKKEEVTITQDVKVTEVVDSKLEFCMGKTFAARGNVAIRTQETAIESLRENEYYCEIGFREAAKKLLTKPPGTYLLRPNNEGIILSFINERQQIEHLRLKVSKKGKIFSGPFEIDFALQAYMIRHMPPAKAALFNTQESSWQSVWSEDAKVVVTSSQTIDDGDFQITVRDDQPRYSGVDDPRKEGISMRNISLIRDHEVKRIYHFRYENWEEGSLPSLIDRLIHDSTVAADGGLILVEKPLLQFYQKRL